MTADKKARLAFLGCGGFCTASILPGVARSGIIDIVAMCDIDRERAEDRARRFGGSRVYTDYEEMLDKEQVDGVFVIGPAPQQYELAPKVLERGIPVYVEKPSANTSAQAVEMAGIAEKHGTWGQVGFMKRFCEAYTIGKEIINCAEFGSIATVHIKFGQGDYPQIWGIDSARRAFLIGQCVHIFDLARFFGGEVKAVYSLYTERTETQFAYLINVEFANGVIGQINITGLESSKAFSDIQERLEVAGDMQLLTIEDMASVDWKRKEDWLSEPVRRGKFSSQYRPALLTVVDGHTFYGYKGEAEHFARRCLGEVCEGPDLWDSARALAIGEAVYESAQSGQRVVVAQV